MSRNCILVTEAWKICFVSEYRMFGWPQQRKTQKFTRRWDVILMQSFLLKTMWPCDPSSGNENSNSIPWDAALSQLNMGVYHKARDLWSLISTNLALKLQYRYKRLWAITIADGFQCLPLLSSPKTKPINQMTWLLLRPALNGCVILKINNDDIDKREINNNTRQIEGKLTLHKVSCGVLTINRVRFHNPPLLLTKARTVSFLALCSHSDLDSVPVKY